MQTSDIIENKQSKLANMSNTAAAQSTDYPWPNHNEAADVS